MGIQAARKRNNRSLFFTKERDFFVINEEMIVSYLCLYKTTKSKMTYLTLLKNLVLMGNFVFVLGSLVMTNRMRKLFF